MAQPAPSPTPRPPLATPTASAVPLCDQPTLAARTARDPADQHAKTDQVLPLNSASWLALNELDSDYVQGPSIAALPRLPGFEIIRELGRGGMGVVYLANQMELGRRVAIKMVLTGGHAGREDLARFRAEAEAIAQVRHPGIVQIHEIGTFDGRPYFVMEFVEGGSLDSLLNHKPQPPEAAAVLVGKLARAVHAAHERGIIHRDLKPANVLVAPADPGPNGASRQALDAVALARLEPKIADFGLAKRLAVDSKHTSTGMVLGTPNYMAPEQAMGKAMLIGPATDVYALGGILYEMLTGRPPFQGVVPVEVIMQVISDEPVPPHQLQPGVPRDLEVICQKCLAKEPGRRYSSALALAEDLDRFTRGEPILARPVGPWERLWKWSRRKPAVAGLAAALVVTVFLALTGLTWLYWQATSAAAEAREEKAKADAARQAESDEKAKVLAERAKVDSINTFLLKDLLGQVHPNEAKKDRITFLEVLNRAAERIPEVFADQPELAGTLHFHLGMAYTELAEYDRAEKHLKRAIALQSDHLGPDALPTLESRGQWGIVLQHLQRTDESVTLFEDLLPRMEKVAGKDSPKTYDCMNNLAAAYHAKGKLRDAEALLQKVVVWRIDHLGTDHEDTLTALGNLGVIQFTRRRLPEAAETLRLAWETAKRKQGPDHAGTLMFLNNLAFTLRQLGRAEEAEPLLRECLESRHRLYGPDHPETLTAMNNLSLVLSSLKNHADAIALQKEILELARKRPERHPGRETRTLTNLISCTRDAGDWDESLKWCKELAAVQKRENTKADDVLKCLVWLGEAQLNTRAFTDAVATFQDALAFGEEKVPPTHPTLGVGRTLLGRAWYFLNDLTQAEAEMLAGERILAAAPPDFTGRRLSVVSDLIQLYQRQGKSAEAEKWRAVRDSLRNAKAASPP